MKYIINYTNEGKILGFAKGDTDLNIEVSNAIWFEAQNYNKIIIDNANANFIIDGEVDDRAIRFDKVDWRTPEELLQETQNKFREARGKLLTEADIEINKLVDAGLDSAEWRAYRQALRDATTTLVMPTKPTEDI